MGLFLPPAGIVQNAGFVFSVLQQLGVLAANPDTALPQTGVWRPPQWSGAPLYSLTVITTQLPGTASPNPDGIEPLPGAPPFPQSTVYIFDAILRAEHRREIRLTHHPVQTGEAISDHAFVEPAEVTLEIGMSDAMDSFTPGQWNTAPTKSISAYQTLKALNLARNFVTLQTRLDTYNNMVVERIETPEDYKTLHGLHAIVTFREVLLATVTAVSSKLSFSALPHVTNSTAAGTVLPTAVSSAVTAQHAVSNASANVLSEIPKVPGAGNWSGTNINALSQLV